MTDRESDYRAEIVRSWGGWWVRWYDGPRLVANYGPFAWRGDAENLVVIKMAVKGHLHD